MTITAYYIKNQADIGINRFENSAGATLNMLMHNNAKALQGLTDLG